MRLPAALLTLLAALLLAAPASADFGFLREWGGKGSKPGQFGLPDGIVVDNAGTVWVADRDNNRIQRFTSDGKVLPFEPFRRRHRSAEPGRFNLPYSVATDAIGNLYVADTHNHRIQVFTPTGKLIRAWGSFGSGDGQMNQPRSLTLDPFGNVWVADHENKRVLKFSNDGRQLGRFGRNGGDGSYGGGVGEFNSPRGLGTDPAGNVYVADDANHRVVKLDNDGNWLASWGRPDNTHGPGRGEFNLPYGVAIDTTGDIWVADTKNHRLVEMNPLGEFLTTWGANGGDGTEGHGPGEFDEIYNVATDCVGNVYATDDENHRVQKFGDPAYRRPVCPPGVFAGATGGSPAGGVTAAVRCDRTCVASATATLRIPGQRAVRLRARERVLPNGAEETLVLRLPRRARAAAERAIARGGRPEAVVRLKGRGAPGAHRTLTRRVRLTR